MSDIKPSIVSNVKRALQTGEKSTPHERNVEDILTSVKDGIKKLVKHGQASFQRIREERQKTKVFSRISAYLADIKKNTKPDRKRFNIIKLLLLMVGGMLMRTAKGFMKIGKLFARVFRRFTKFFGKGFKETRLFKSLKNIITKFRNIGKIKGIRGFIATIKKLFSGFAVFKKLKGISGIFTLIKKFFKGFAVIGKMFKPVLALLKPLAGVLGKLLWPITVVLGIIDGLKGLANATKWFGKEEGELVTIGEKISAVVGSVISGLTFGLLGSGEEMAKGIHKAFSNPIKFLTEDVPVMLLSLGDKLWSLTIKVSSFLGDMITNVVTKVTDFFRNVDWAMVGESIVDTLWKLIKLVANTIWTVLKELPGFILNSINLIVPLLWEVVKGIANLIWGVLSKIGSLIWEGIQPIVTRLQEIVSNISIMVVDWVIGIVTSVKESIVNAFNSAVEIGEGIVEAITGWMRNLGLHIWGAIKSMFMNSPQDETKDSVIDSIIIWMKKLGASIWNAIGSGIKNVVGSITDKLKFWKRGKKDKVVERVDDVVEIETPLTEKISSDVERKAELKEIKDINREKKGGIGFDLTTSTEAEKMDMFMNFMVNQFADVMAKKISVAVNKGDVTSINPPKIRII